MEIQIKRAKLSDAEELALVETKAHLNDSNVIKPQEFRMRSYVELLNGGKDIFVLTGDGKIAAVCIILSCEDNDCLCYADIVEICVIPEMQNKGFAKKLISHSLDVIRKKGFTNAYARYLGGTENSCEDKVSRLFKGLGFGFRKFAPDNNGVYEIAFTKRI